MNKNFNIISDDVCLISPELEYGLITSKLDNIDFNAKHPKGVYLVKFKKLKSNNIIFYSYIYYNELFTTSLLAYYKNRHFANNLLAKDINNWLVLIDNNFFNKYEDLKSIQGLQLNVNLVEDLQTITFDGNLKDLFSYIFSLNYIGSIDDIVSLIKHDIEFKYFDIIKQIFKKHPSVITFLNCFSEDNIVEFNSSIPFSQSFLKNCLIVCTDLDETLSKFRASNLSINSGVQSKRDEVNSLDYHLSIFDKDYLNSLYYHYRHHKQKSPTYLNYTATRDHFSHDNVHTNLGTSY